MHDAFEPVPILEKLPLQIDCLAAWGEPDDRGARTSQGSGEVGGRLAVWASVGRCPRGAWAEGVRSVVDTAAVGLLGQSPGTQAL